MPIVHYYDCSEDSRLYGRHRNPKPLDDIDWERLIRVLDINIDEVWYWYACSLDDGLGQLLMRHGNKWDIHDMSHCSCYGPVDEAKFSGRYHSLKELQDVCSKELLDGVMPLIRMAQKEGFS